MSGYREKVKLTNVLMKEICPQSGIAPNKVGGCVFAKADTQTRNLHVTAQIPSHRQT